MIALLVVIPFLIHYFTQSASLRCQLCRNLDLKRYLIEFEGTVVVDLNMEDRARRYRQTRMSPERNKVWTEKSPKYHQSRKVPVVYYLCKNRYLEHPHFIEVPLSSPGGLYLRDVVNRLDDLRGRGLHLKYSWSSKRSYKSGYVWHDLSEDDLIVPVNGHEYILKGSELFEDSLSGCVGPTGSIIVQDLKQLPEPDYAKSRDDSSSSSSRNLKGNKAFQEDECYLSDQHPDSGGISFESRVDGTSGSGDVLRIEENKDDKSRNAADASTQTEEYAIVLRDEDNCAQSGSDDSIESSKQESSNNLQHCIDLERQNSAALIGNGLLPSAPCSSKSSRRKHGVTEFLNKVDAKTVDSFRIPLEKSPQPPKLHLKILDKDVQLSSSPRLKVTDMLIQLISCGSIPVKGHSFGVAHSNRPRFANLNSPSPWYSNSNMPEEFNCLSDNTRLMGMPKEDVYPIGSVPGRKTLSNGHGVAKTSSNIGSGQTINQADPVENKSQLNMSLSESMRSALSVRSRISTDKDDITQNICGASSNGSKRIPYSPIKSPSHLNPSEHGDVITVEERLPTGARVIIHSRSSLDTSG